MDGDAIVLAGADVLNVDFTRLCPESCQSGHDNFSDVRNHPPVATVEIASCLVLLNSEPLVDCIAVDTV